MASSTSFTSAEPTAPVSEVSVAAILVFDFDRSTWAMSMVAVASALAIDLMLELLTVVAEIRLTPSKVALLAIVLI